MNIIALIGAIIGMLGFFGIIYYIGQKIENA